MTLTELLADLSCKYEVVGTPAQIGTVAAFDITEFAVNVLEKGKTRDDLPMHKGHIIVLSVRDYGGGGEDACVKNQLPFGTKHGLATSTGALLDIHRIYADKDIRNRVESAISKAAQDVINEDPGTLNHLSRLDWAIDALIRGRNYSEMFSRFVSLNATVQAAGGTATDNDLQYIVNSYIDAVATALFPHT